jgi:hypothetical protein
VWTFLIISCRREECTASLEAFTFNQRTRCVPFNNILTSRSLHWSRVLIFTFNTADVDFTSSLETFTFNGIPECINLSVLTSRRDSIGRRLPLTVEGVRLRKGCVHFNNIPTSRRDSTASSNFTLISVTTEQTSSSDRRRELNNFGNRSVYRWLN